MMKKRSVCRVVENFWYYHRWMFIFAVVCVVFLLIAVFQLATNKRPDISILYVGPANLSQTNCEDMAEVAEGFLFDVNGDDHVTVEVQAIQIAPVTNQMSQAEKMQAMEEYQRFSDELLGGDCAILFVDEYYYRDLADSGSLVNLYEIFPSLPSAAYDDYGLRFTELDLYDLAGYCYMPDDTIVCLKYSSPLAFPDDNERVEADIYNISLFRALCFGSES